MRGRTAQPHAQRKKKSHQQSGGFAEPSGEIPPARTGSIKAGMNAISAHRLVSFHRHQLAQQHVRTPDPREKEQPERPLFRAVRR